MLQFMDNYSIYGGNTAFMLNGLYAEKTGITLEADPDGTSTGSVLRMAFNGIDNSQTSWRRVLSSIQPTVGVALRLWLAALPTNNNAKTRHIDFRNSANTIIASLSVASTGAIMFNVNGTVYTSPTPNITANGWWHIEAKYVHGAGALASFEVRVEGLPVLQQAGVAAANFDVAQVAQSRDNISGDNQSYMKDLVVWDGSGTHNTDFIGSVLVYSLIPNSDVALNWTPSVGADGFSILDNSPPNDAQFITASTPPPAAYVAGLTNLPANITSVRGLMTVVRATKSDGGDASLQIGIVSVGSTSNGSDRPITVTPTWWTDIFETDPSTAAPFTPGAVDAADLEINRTA